MTNASNTNVKTPKGRDNTVLIIAVTVVVLVVIFMYFHDQNQLRAFELRGLEKRVELLEDWGMPRQNAQ